jgi:hypothetical protein
MLRRLTASRDNRFVPDRYRIASWGSAVTLRLAEEGDTLALHRLAQLDSRPLPPPPFLVAERDGQIDAALSLVTHEVVADPFRRTAELCQLLSCHAGPTRIERIDKPAARLKPRPLTAPA